MSWVVISDPSKETNEEDGTKEVTFLLVG